jgi:SAM-dependent methyltransferase
MPPKTLKTTDQKQKPGFSEYPDFFARFYDLIYHQMRDGVDNRFYLDRIGETKGRILEIGSGTGRLLTEALSEGADIYGIDISPAMLGVLRSKISIEQQARISLQNMISFRFGHKFDLIIAPFRVFMHLTDKSDQLKALEHVFKNLNPGGRFIFDAFIPNLQMLLTGLDNVKDFEGEYEPGKSVKRIVSTWPDLLNQIINMTFTIEWHDGRKEYKKAWNSSLHYFFRFELEHLIERSPFSSYSILGDFEGNELNADSMEFVAICRKSQGGRK